MFQFDPNKYGPFIAELIPERKPSSLGPGTPDKPKKAALQASEIERLFAHTQIKDRDMAKACFSGLWLYHDFLDESHTISQSIHSTTGSYWHGIMHRREPDYSNAGYWFHKVGSHPIFDVLCAEASSLAQSFGTTTYSAFLARQTSWDPFALIQLCEKIYRSDSNDERLCEAVQRLEWQLLFDFSYNHAVL